MQYQCHVWASAQASPCTPQTASERRESIFTTDPASLQSCFKCAGFRLETCTRPVPTDTVCYLASTREIEAVVSIIFRAAVSCAVQICRRPPSVTCGDFRHPAEIKCPHGLHVLSHMHQQNNQTVNLHAHARTHTHTHTHTLSVGSRTDRYRV